MKDRKFDTVDKLYHRLWPAVIKRSGMDPVHTAILEAASVVDFYRKRECPGQLTLAEHLSHSLRADITPFERGLIMGICFAILSERAKL